MEEKKPSKKSKSQPIESKLTLKQKIDKVVDKVGEIDEKNKVELKKDLFILFQKTLYPDQFCPECEERLFFSPMGWSCPNCGFQKQSTTIPQSTPQTIVRPSQIGKVPPQVDKMIAQANENMKEPRRVAAPTNLGSKIRKLVDQRDAGGPSAPTPQDEAKVRGDRNVGGQINWV
jgi:uncharacterized Zn finger protein (UPF0148 family)